MQAYNEFIRSVLSINIAFIEPVEMCPVKRLAHNLQDNSTSSDNGKADKENVIRQNLFQMTESRHEF